MGCWWRVWFEMAGASDGGRLIDADSNSERWVDEKLCIGRKMPRFTHDEKLGSQLRTRDFDMSLRLVTVLRPLWSTPPRTNGLRVGKGMKVYTNTYLTCLKHCAAHLQ